MNTVSVVSLPGGTRIVFSVSADDALAEVKLRQARFANPSPYLSRVAGLLRADAREQFAEGGSPAWKPLAPSTIAAKSAANLPSLLPSGRVPRRLKQNGTFGSTAILIASGRLRDSWGRLDSPDHLEEIDVQAGTVRIGSKLPYAAIHQTGGTRSYQIAAKSGKTLAFQGVSGRVFARKVNHPPLAARPVTVTEGARRKMADEAERYFGGEDMGTAPD